MLCALIDTSLDRLLDIILTWKRGSVGKHYVKWRICMGKGIAKLHSYCKKQLVVLKTAIIFIIARNLKYIVIAFEE